MISLVKVSLVSVSKSGKFKEKPITKSAYAYSISSLLLLKSHSILEKISPRHCSLFVSR